jgi:hypothetical protein
MEEIEAMAQNTQIFTDKFNEVDSNLERLEQAVNETYEKLQQMPERE